MSILRLEGVHREVGTFVITILGITQSTPTLPNSISGTVFIDVNNNGLQGSVEMGLRYVTMSPLPPGIPLPCVPHSSPGGRSSPRPARRNSST